MSNQGIKAASVQRIRDLCKEHHLSLYELAYKAGISYSGLKAALSRCYVSLLLIKKLCDALDISMADFFTSKIFDDLDPEID